jgi:single-strand DNA-binding protein
MDSWDDKISGQKRTKLKVVADNIQLIGSKGGSQAPRPKQHEPASSVAAISVADDFEDDEPPF